jgi:hypothetical protein
VNAPSAGGRREQSVGGWVPERAGVGDIAPAAPESGLIIQLDLEKKMIRNLLPRRADEFLIAMTLVTGMTVGFASSASAASPSSIEGKSCTWGEVGDEVFTIESATVSPVVTHFTSFNVTPGTNSANTYHLSVVDRVSTSINDNTNDGNIRNNTRNTGTDGDSGETRSLFDQVSHSVGFTVHADDATTSTQDATVQWRFNDPGYYGLYKGTMRVTGTFSRTVCSPDWKSPRYERLGGGTYSTFGPIEEGTVVCGDVLPAGTVRRAAQTVLGCAAPAVPATDPAAGPALPKTAVR